MTEQPSSKNYFKFNTSSALLKELGERLVAKADVAFIELIKNSHDADATTCDVEINNNMIIIKDNGHGMTKTEFNDNWMTIATTNKIEKNKSRNYARSVTGAKGVGRFSTRFLGEYLKIQTVAYDKEEQKRKKLTIDFDWLELDKQSNINTMEISYLYEDTNEEIGTTLYISKLRHKSEDFTSKKVFTEILKLTNPFESLKPKELDKYYLLDKKNSIKDNDPGFNVNIDNKINSIETNEKSDFDIPSLVLKRFVGQVIVEYEKNSDEVSITLTIDKKKKLSRKVFKLPGKINSNIYADIRHFPRRKGTFAQIEQINGTDAWTWVRANHGISVYDKGFKIKPYGEEDDDWLHLDIDNSHSERNWRSKLMDTNYPMTPDEEKKPKLNPMLYLPTNYQVVGSVYLSSNGEENNDLNLIPAMDRTGFIENDAYKFLTEIIRFSVELIAKFDKDNILEKERLENEILIAESKRELDDVIEHIRSSHTLSLEDKTRLIKVYEHLQDNIEDIDAYNRESRESLEIMSLLGAVAGFMTHEYQSTLFELQNAITTLKKLSKEHKELVSVTKGLEKSLDYFTGYIEYTSSFIRNIREGDNSTFIKVLPRITYVLNTFKQFREERNIKVDYSEVYDDLMAPSMPIAMYDGIIHNLYSNALKVLISHEDNGIGKLIKINAFNDKDKHIIYVMDNGPGIPKEIENRIWDPLYTTTSSNENNPLGSGMGIGLPMIKRVIEAQKGSISLIDPPSGFSTCFKITLPFKKEKAK
jgi:signal transduction histidine kinase